MAGLLTLLGLTAIGISAAKHTEMNIWSKNNLRHTLPNGIEYYTDADGKKRLLNGTQIFWAGYGEREKVIEIKSRRVIYDRLADFDKANEIRKQESFENNNLLYIKRNPRCHGDGLVFFEFKTGKQLAKVEKIFNKKTKEAEYRKWYHHDWVKKEHPGLRSYDCAIKVNYYDVGWDNKGIIITEEEFEKIVEESKKLTVNDNGYERRGHIAIDYKYI